MTNQSNAAAERSAHVERGPRRIPGESFLVEVSPGVFQIKALAEARAEIERLRAEIVLLEATGADASDEIERLRAQLEQTRTVAAAAVKAARREGIEAAANVCTKFLSTIQSEIDRASTSQVEEALWAAFLTIEEAEAAIRKLLTEEPAHD